jgi:uncharacterized protein (TIGR00369 family)
MTSTIPDGFLPWTPSSPFMQHIATLGDVYFRESDGVMALLITPAHANMHAMAHGGLLATLADCALGSTVSRKSGSSVVTAQMSLEYMNAVNPGDWLEAHVQIDKQGKRLIYASCALKVEGRMMLRASGVFATLKAPGPTSDG